MQRAQAAPRGLGAHELLGLQRTLGNAAVRGLLATTQAPPHQPRIQRAINVGEDSFEPAALKQQLIADLGLQNSDKLLAGLTNIDQDGTEFDDFDELLQALVDGGFLGADAGSIYDSGYKAKTAYTRATAAVKKSQGSKSSKERIGATKVAGAPPITRGKRWPHLLIFYSGITYDFRPRARSVLSLFTNVVYIEYRVWF